MRLTGRGSKNATLSFGRSTILRSSRSYRSITQYEAECCVRFFGSILRLSSRIMIRSATMSAALNNMWCGGIHRHCRPASPAAGDRTCSPVAAAGIRASRRDPRRRRRYAGTHYRRARRNADRDSDRRDRRSVFSWPFCFTSVDWPDYDRNPQNQIGDGADQRRHVGRWY